MRLSRKVAIAAALGALLLQGCAIAKRDVPLFARARLVPDFDTYVVHRVGLMPVRLPVGGDRSTRGESAFLQEWFASQLAQSTPYEVVALPVHTLTEIDSGDSRLAGHHDAKSIVELARRFKLDAVLLVEVTDRSPYPPQSVSITAELVATETGATIWSSDVHLDARDPRVRDGLEAFTVREEGAQDGADRWDVVLLSPRRFAEYGLWQLAQML